MGASADQRQLRGDNFSGVISFCGISFEDGSPAAAVVYGQGRMFWILDIEQTCIRCEGLGLA